MPNLLFIIVVIALTFAQITTNIALTFAQICHIIALTFAF
jgi:hypothetical protein